MSLRASRPSAKRSTAYSGLRPVSGGLFLRHNMSTRSDQAQALKAGVKMRADVENMLTIIRDGGATALRKALKDPSQLLPVLAGLGVYGAGGSDTPETSPARRSPSQ